MSEATEWNNQQIEKENCDWDIETQHNILESFEIKNWWLKWINKIEEKNICALEKFSSLKRLRSFKAKIGYFMT